MKPPTTLKKNSALPGGVDVCLGWVVDWLSAENHSIFTPIAGWSGGGEILRQIIGAPQFGRAGVGAFQTNPKYKNPTANVARAGPSPRYRLLA